MPKEMDEPRPPRQTQRGRFAPTIAARRVKPDPGETVGDARITVDAKDAASVRTGSRSSGRQPNPRHASGERAGGKGLLAAQASGPFAQGPAAPRTRHTISSVVSRVKKDPGASALVGTECEESAESLENYLTNRTIGDHLPVSLAGNGCDRVGPESVGFARLQPGKLMLFQLPACMPAPADDGNAVTTPTVSSPLSAGEEERAMDIEAFRSLQTTDLQHKPSWPANAEGYYGKLRIHASGRMTLQVDDQTMEATPSTVRADVMGVRRAVAIDPDYEQSFDMGPVEEALIFVPSLDRLLQLSFCD